MKGIQSNGFLPIIAQAIAEMEELHGEFAGINEINLAELGRRTGISRAKLRRLKANGFCETPHGLIGPAKGAFAGRIQFGFGQLTEKRSQQFYCLSGTTASNWLFRKPKHSETVHRLPQASHPRQATADRTAGQPRAPLYDRSR